MRRPQTKSDRNKHRFQFVMMWSVLLLILLFSSLFTYLCYEFWHNEKLVENNAFQLASKQASAVASKIDEGFAKITQSAQDLAGQLSEGKLKHDELWPTLESTLQAFPTLFGISVAFKPYQYNNEQRLYAPFLVRDQKNYRRIQIENVYDYTIPKTTQGQPDTAWYLIPLEKNASVWLEPYYGTASQQLVVDRSMPFYFPKKAHTKENQAGVVTYTASLRNVNRYVASMLLGDTSYAYILSKKGVIISHPVGEFIGMKVPHVQKAARERREYHDSKTGKTYWQFSLPLKTANWKININLDKDNFMVTPKIKMHYVSWIILTGVITLLLLSILILRAYRGTVFSLWSVSIASSVIFLIGVVLLWHFFIFFMEPVSGTKIMDKAALNRYLLLHADVGKKGHILYVPTGVLLQSVYFPSQNRVGLSGYIWQKYPKKMPSNINPGFLLQHQVGFTSIKEISREVVGHQTIIVWHFNTNIRQSMDPFVYPLDKENITLKLWHKDFAKNVMLIPDLDGYATLAPQALPGVSDDIFLEDWLISKTFFSYKTHNYKSYFGLDPSHIKTRIPELYFNVSIARNVVNPILSYLIPLLLVASMLFAIVMSGKTTHIISYAGAMLIVITVAHVALRNSIAVQGISYLETYYIVLYPLIVAVTVSFLLKGRRAGQSSMIHLRDNLLVKVLYWPMILGVNFIITLLFFGFN